MESFFRKPWVEKLLSTFDTVSVTPVTCTRQESIVCQIMNVKLINENIDGVDYRCISEVHDNHLYVKSVFTRSAVQDFEEEEEEKCSGIEFDETIKNSIVYVQNYHVIPHLNDDQTRCEFILCVDRFSMGHYDAYPRWSRYPLILANDKKSVADNLYRVWRTRMESIAKVQDEGSVASTETSMTADSSLHLTQLLDEMNKIAEEQEVVRDGCTRVFTMTVETSDDASDLDILCDALNEMERKLTIAKSLHHLLSKNASAGAQRRGADGEGGLQQLNNVPAFRISELPCWESESEVMVDGLDASDFDEVPVEVLKQLEQIKEWQPGYVQPSSLPSNSKSCEWMDMRGGGESISSTSVEKRIDNGQTSEEPPSQQYSVSEDMEKRIDNGQTSEEPPSQQYSVSEDMSIGSGMSSIESIGLSTEEMQLENSPTIIEHHSPLGEKMDERAKMCENAELEDGENEDAMYEINKTVQLSLTMRKRPATSDGGESPNKIMRRDSPERAGNALSTAAVGESSCEVQTMKETELAHGGQGTSFSNNRVDTSGFEDKTEFPGHVNKEQGGSSPNHSVFEPAVASSPITVSQGLNNAILAPHSPDLQDINLEGPNTELEVVSSKLDNTGLPEDCASWKEWQEGDLQDMSEEDIFEISEKENIVTPPSVQELYAEETTCPDARSDAVGVHRHHDKAVVSETKKQPSNKTVHFDECVRKRNHPTEQSDDRQCSASDHVGSSGNSPMTSKTSSLTLPNRTFRKPSGDGASARNSSCTSAKPLNQDPAKQQPTKELKTSETADDHDGSVEILNTSTGFEPNQFYSSPSPTSVRRKRAPRVLAKLTSPQIPSSIPTPVNSLPSHQPRRSRLSALQPADSQSSVNSGNYTEISMNQRSMDSSMEQLSSVKLDKEILQWCTGHFIDMVKQRETKKKKKNNRRT